MIFAIKTKTPDGQIFKFTKYNPLKQSISRDETTNIEDPEERKSRLRALKRQEFDRTTGAKCKKKKSSGVYCTERGRDVK